MPKTKVAPTPRSDRHMFSIGSEVSDHLDFLVGRWVKIDGTAGTSRTDVVRDLIEGAYAAVKSPKKKRA
jgi:hypothetical protein